jgi:hypothetical protein
VLKGKFHSDSGANFVASEADLDEFNRQLEEATQFLEQHATVIAKITAYPAIESAILDFGVALNAGYVSQSSYLPPAFIKLAADAGIGVEISHYACSKDDKES